MEAGSTKRMRALALVIALAGLALTAYVEVELTATTAGDPFGWFVYEAAAWLVLLGIGPFLPVSLTVLVGAMLALGFEALVFWRVFVLPGGAESAGIYLWKPLVQLALIAAAWFAGYLIHLRGVRSRTHG
jgi:uncharacterized membrane protein